MILVALTVCLSTSLIPLASAQSREEVQAADAAPVHADDRPRVFLDCQEDCFVDYVRTEVTFVDYVRDRADADVHVLVTLQETGAGGRERTLGLIGQGRFAEMNETLRHVSEKDEPEERVRRGLVQTLKLGLMRYVLKTGMASHIQISSAEPAAKPRATKDRWNSWVFAVRGEGELDGEESQSQYRVGLSLSADRVTREWKASVGVSTEHEEEKFDVDGRDVVSTKIERVAEGFVVKSLGPHWSLGASGAIGRNTFENTRRSVRFGPMLEYSVFPYDEATRRQVRIAYRLETGHVEYEEETLFERTSEALTREEIELRLERRERWGSLVGELEVSHYLHDLGKYRVEGEFEAALRIFQGLSLNMSGRASRVRDQLSLPRRGATAEEILLEQRQLASGYEYEAGIGLTFTFGSIYNNVVNPRFGN